MSINCSMDDLDKSYMVDLETIFFVGRRVKVNFRKFNVLKLVLMERSISGTSSHHLNIFKGIK